MSSFLFVTVNLAVAYLAIDLSALVAKKDPLYRLLLSLVLFSSFALLLSILCSFVGTLTSTPLLIASSLAALCLFSLKRRRLLRIEEPVLGEDPLLESALGPIEWLGAAMLLAAATPTYLRAILGPTRFNNWDDLYYHATAVGHWFLEKGLGLFPADYHAYFPMNAEVMSLWFVLPFGHDAFVGLAPLLWASISIISLVVLGRQLTTRLGPGFVAAALFMVSPVVRTEIGTFSAPDLAASAFIMAATATVLQCSRNLNVSHVRTALTAGLAAGFALGCKVSYAPFIVILASLTTIISPSGRARLVSGLAFLTGSFATGSFWYLRNWRITGNPIFPAEFGPFQGPFDSAAQASSSLFSIVTSAVQSGKPLWKTIDGMIDWPPSLAVICLIGYLFSVWALFSSTVSARSKGQIVTLATLGFTAIILYPSIPFSGATEIGNEAILLRYQTFPFALGICLFTASFATLTSRVATFLALGLTVTAFATAWSGTDLDRIAALLAVVVAAVLAKFWTLNRFKFQVGMSKSVLGGLLALLVALTLLEPSKLRATESLLFDGTYWSSGSGWRQLDGLPSGSRIAWFGREGRRYYPVFGRRLQNVPVPVLGAGNSFIPVHERWEQGRFTWSPPEQHWGWKVMISPERLVQNLSSSKVEYAFVSRILDDEWPSQLELLEAAAGVEEIFRSDKAVIFRLP